jgi:hypothetical protein
MKIEVNSESSVVITLTHKEAIDVEALFAEYCETSLNPFRGILSCEIAASIRSSLLGGE